MCVLFPQDAIERAYSVTVLSWQPRTALNFHFLTEPKTSYANLYVFDVAVLYCVLGASRAAVATSTVTL